MCVYTCVYLLFLKVVSKKSGAQLKMKVKQNVAASHTNKSETFKTPREYIWNELYNL